jgi:hypothetical protein
VRLLSPLFTLVALPAPLLAEPVDLRRGNPGKTFPLHVINKALHLCKLRRIALETRGCVPRNLTYQAIAIKCGVWSKNTISRWDNSDMTADAIFERRGRYEHSPYFIFLVDRKVHRKFTRAEEDVLAGWIVYKDLTLESSTTEKFREFVQTYFGKEISPSYITRFMRRFVQFCIFHFSLSFDRHHFSLKLVGRAHYAEKAAETFRKGLEFFDSFRELVRRYVINDLLNLSISRFLYD